MRAIVFCVLAIVACGDDTIVTQPGDGGASDATLEADALPHPCTGTAVTKGPWVLAVDDTHATIRWETCRTGTSPTITLTPSDADAGTGTPITAQAIETETDLVLEHDAVLNPNATPDYAGAWFMHEAALANLPAASCWDYVLAADASRVGHFCTAKPSGAPLRLVAIGDTNVGLGPITGAIVSQVAPMNPDFTMHLGDLEYYDSGMDTWQLWDQVMRPLLAKGAFFPAVGNHESETPDEYQDYTLRFFHGAGFAGNDEFYWFENAGVYFFVLDTQDATDATSAQANWFAQQIVIVEQNPGYRFSIVYFHKPFVTCGDTDDDPVARQYFEPLFLLHKVPLVLQAHMHGYERFDFGNITYVTSAGGGGAIGDVNANIGRSYCAQRVASGPIFHATVLDIDTAITGSAIDPTGAVRDNYTITIP
jgi:hypothetical protein